MNIYIYTYIIVYIIYDIIYICRYIYITHISKSPPYVIPLKRETGALTAPGWLFGVARACPEANQ